MSRLAHLCFKQVAIYPDTFSCLLPRQEGRHDGTMSIKTSSYVCHCYANFAGRAVRFTRSCTPSSAGQRLREEKKDEHVHESSLCFDDHVVACSVSIRARLTIAYEECEPRVDQW